jgi:hypothetical protein
VLCTTSAPSDWTQNKSTLNERLIPADKTTCGGDLARVNAQKSSQTQAEQQAQAEQFNIAKTQEEQQAQAEQFKTEQTILIEGELNEFEAELEEINARDSILNEREKLPTPIRNATTWAEKYQALKDITEEIDITTMNEKEIKSLHRALKELEGELFCGLDDEKVENHPSTPVPPKPNEKPLPPPEPPPTMTQYPSEYPSTPKRTNAPPGSLLSELTRPASPTNICDFPYFDLDETKQSVQQEVLNLPILPTTTSRLPKLTVNRTIIDSLQAELATYQRDSDQWDESEKAEQVSTYNIIADVGTYGKTFVVSKTVQVDGAKLMDSGANCSMTADISKLTNLRKLDQPIVIGVAVNDNGDSSANECTHIGDLQVKCDDGSTISTICFYNPSASDTIISPQSIIDHSTQFKSWTQVGRRFGQAGTIQFNGDGITKSLTLQQNNGLYYCNSETFDIFNDYDEAKPTINRMTMQDVDIQTEEIKKRPKRQPKRHTPASKAKILESETWYLRLGGCSETALEDLTEHAIGLPKSFEWHPFRFIDFKEQARIQKRPVGRNPTRVAERGRRFYFDFGFIRASNEDYSRPTKEKDRVIESYDGFTSYLLVVDEVSKYSWIFLTKSKDPPIELTRLFLEEYAHVDGGKIRCDQGGELARSAEWRKMVLEKYKYYVEPTGADSPSQNGQVEKYNGTLGTIVRTLLYGASLPAKYWSAAAVHAVYLMNRRVHSAIGMTPYEAWWDENQTSAF